MAERIVVTVVLRSACSGREVVAVADGTDVATDWLVCTRLPAKCFVGERPACWFGFLRSGF